MAPLAQASTPRSVGPSAPSAAAQVQVKGDRPVGALRNLVLAQDVFADNSGTVLAIDRAGTLWAYPAGKGGQLGRPMAIGSGFDGTRLIPGDGAGLMNS
ncbi:MAG: hypothetical protein FWG16_03960, partial [Micrococcales bacterium]|nr:hypothetical protein [Micrococcales bacterium]